MKGGRRHPNLGAGAQVSGETRELLNVLGAEVVEDRARVEWWRRSSFMLLGVVFALLGGWIFMLSDGVAENAADVEELRMSMSDLSADLRVLTNELGSLAVAQRETTRELATIAAILDTLKNEDAARAPE